MADYQGRCPPNLSLVEFNQAIRGEEAVGAQFKDAIIKFNEFILVFADLDQKPKSPTVFFLQQQVGRQCVWSGDIVINNTIVGSFAYR